MTAVVGLLVALSSVGRSPVRGGRHRAPRAAALARLPLWLGLLVSMAAGAALAVPLIGAPLPTSGILVAIAVGWSLVRRRRRPRSASPVVHFDDADTAPSEAPIARLRREIGESTNRHAA